MEILVRPKQARVVGLVQRVGQSPGCQPWVQVAPSFGCRFATSGVNALVVGSSGRCASPCFQDLRFGRTGREIFVLLYNSSIFSISVIFEGGYPCCFQQAWCCRKRNHKNLPAHLAFGWQRTEWPFQKSVLRHVSAGGAEFEVLWPVK